MATTSEKLVFIGVDGRDVYNISAPFTYLEQTVIAGRVEKRDEELSEIVLFTESADGWIPVDGAPVFHGLQDPCATNIGGKLLLGGVRFPIEFPNGETGWQMDFYLESGDGQFEKVLSGPPKMKDIRFVQQAGGSIVVFTRPQGDKGGRGEIGYFVAQSLEEITHERINAAPLLDLCPEEEWVGANEAHVLANGKIGVLGHIARFSHDGHRHYYSMVFCLDPVTGKYSPLEIIAKREDFPAGVAKRPDLVDVIFSGGIRRLDDGMARLYAGLSDAEAGYVDIPDPFLPFE